jgi:hypothetical protein
MPRIRTIKPEFWTDSKTGTLSPFATKLFLGLLNHCDDYGVVPLDLAEFKAKILPYEEGDIATVIAEPLQSELIARKLVIHFRHDGEEYLFIRTFHKHQRVNRPGPPLIPGWKRGDTPESFIAGGGSEQLPQGIEQQQLQGLTEHSVNTHGTFSEDSVNVHRMLCGERKGKERKGKNLYACKQAYEIKGPASPASQRKNKNRVAQADARFPLTVAAISEACKRHEVGFCWDESEGKQLKAWLKANKSLPMEEISRLIENRFKSRDGSPGARPRLWIQDLSKYTAVLDRFGRPEGMEADERLTWDQKITKRNNELIERIREKGLDSLATGPIGKLFPN